MQLHTAHIFYYKLVVILYLLPTHTTLKPEATQLAAITINKNTNSHDCPPWGELQDNRCVCRKKLSNYYSVKCDNETLQLSVIKCHCVTFNNETKQLFEGNCFENCNNPYSKHQYLPLPSNITRLNQFMCEERWNRTGRLCGKCLPGHSPLVYSYKMRCVKCPEGNRNVWKYILVAFGPLTGFYLLVLFFKINAISSHLHGYLIFSQIISAHVVVRDLFKYVQNHPQYTPVLIAAGLGFSVWNLDIFRAIYPDICLDVSTLTALSLDYAVAIYPLLLTVVSYFLIELHARNVKVVVILWKPFRYILIHLRRNWDSRTTVIDAYTTFFVLSFVKITSVSADLLIPARAYSLNDDSVTWVLYYDGTVDYFGREHLPYAILAIACTVFVTAPTILLLLVYQFKCFQKLLSCLKLRCRLLAAVMDSFQGCYKNGTEAGVRDYRWFAAVPFIVLLIMLITYSAFLDTSILPLEIVICTSAIVLIAVTQPYKKRNYTKIDIIFWGLLATFIGAYASIADGYLLKSPTTRTIGHVLAIAVVIIALLYIPCLFGYWVLSRVKKVKTLINRIKAWRRNYRNAEADFEATLPDRVAHPEHYQLEDLDIDTY